MDEDVKIVLAHYKARLDAQQDLIREMWEWRRATTAQIEQLEGELGRLRCGNVRSAVKS